MLQITWNKTQKSDSKIPNLTAKIRLKTPPFGIFWDANSEYGCMRSSVFGFSDEFSFAKNRI